MSCKKSDDCFKELSKKLSVSKHHIIFLLTTKIESEKCPQGKPATQITTTLCQYTLGVAFPCEKVAVRYKVKRNHQRDVRLR